MKKRNLFLVCVLTILTLGIYLLVWLYDTRKDAVKQLNEPKAIPPVSILFLPFMLLLVSFVFSLATRDSNAGNVIVLLVGIVAVPAIFIVPLWWFYKYSHGMYRVTHGTEPMLLYVLFIVLYTVGLGFVWMILVQNDINKALEHQVQAPQPPDTTPAIEHSPPQPWQQQPPAPSPMPQPPYTPPQPPVPKPSQQPDPPARPDDHIQNLPPPARPL